MANLYAGTLGLLAFLTCLARGIVHGGGIESVLWTACGSMLAFAVVGYVMGWVAGQTVDEAVHGRITAELAEQDSNDTASPAATAGPR